MARMIPPTIHSNVRSGAERRLFRVIDQTPGTRDWICLHSLGLARHATKRRGEIDFVLITPVGVFALEVKGGRVRREQGVWIYTDRFDVEHRKHEGPFEQASSAMFALEREVRKFFNGDPIESALFGYGVVVPDIEFESLGCDSDPALVYDTRDRSKPFTTYVKRLAAFAEGRQGRERSGLTLDAIDRLADFLRGDFDLVPSMAGVIEDVVEQLIELTREQRVVLDAIDQTRRSLIYGSAGTGKTMLALEAARRAAREGLRVLFLVYNRMLAARLRAEASSEDYAGSVVVGTVHSHFQRLIKESSLFDEFSQRREGVAEDVAYSTLYPEYAALAALESADAPYDMLVVDEAQDVLTLGNVEALNELLRGGLEDGSWRLFLDSNNQACVYGQLDQAALDELRQWADAYVLTVNCRNTTQITLHTNALSEPQTSSHGRVEGPAVEFVSYGEDHEILEKLRDIVSEVLSCGVPPGLVSVLFPRTPTAQASRQMEKMGVRPLTEADASLVGTRGLTACTWSTVSSFKGLENDVVIVAGVSNVEAPWWRAITYVGMSRARINLYVIIRKNCEATRLERLERALQLRLSQKTEGAA